MRKAIKYIVAFGSMLWIYWAFLAPASNVIHLQAKPSDDGYVRVWKVPGSAKPIYKMVHESVSCIRMDEFEHYPVKLITAYYYIHVGCGDVYGFVSNYDVREYHP